MKTPIFVQKRAMKNEAIWGPLYGLLLAAPRVLVPLAGLAAACSAASGCVPATRYEEASSAADVESEAHRRAGLALAAAQARVAELEAEIQRRDQGLDARDQKLAEEQFAHGVAAKELDETSSLLEQLRGDLLRANQNLEVYAADNARLEQKSAQKAAAGADASPISALSRELETAVGAAHLDPRVRVVERESSVLLQIDASALFESDRSGMRVEVQPAFDAAGSFLVAHPTLRCSLREGRSDPAFATSLGRERRERLATAIAERRLADRVSFQVPDSTSAATPETYELVLTLAPPPP
jgi:flagellar motor protein MotB